MTAVLVFSCGAPKKIEEIRAQQMRANIALPADRAAAFKQFDTGKPQRDTLFVKDEKGNDLIVMKTTTVDGEVMASEVLQAAVVTARFRNVAERHGKIDLEFDIIVPKKMIDSKWKLRFDPDMFIKNDSIRLDPVYVTGKEYRLTQERGEELFARYLRSIVKDTTVFQWAWQLDLFLERNIPQVFAYANDTSLVDVDTFEAVRLAQEKKYRSETGVTVAEATAHYTNWILRHRNDRKIARIGKMRRKYIKDPIVREGIRLDTIIQEVNGDFRYRYVQTVETRPKLRKIDIVLSGDIFEGGKVVYRIPPCEPLTFYVSSVATLLSDEERYLTRIVERKADASTACYIAFNVGKSDIDDGLGNNATEMTRIKRNLRSILMNDTFDLDSISITAYASPEGPEGANGRLSAKRAEAAGHYFNSYVKHVRDSLRRAAGMKLVIGDDGSSGAMESAYEDQGIKFLSYNGGENWKMLDYLMDIDTLFNNATKEEYFSLREKLSDRDACEWAFHRKPYYNDMRARLYPYCRVVAFDFHMHRKGMVKDTIHTTVLDSVYMAGVQAIRNRDYESAVALLHDYQDYNCAIAYIALDRDKSAMRILEKMKRTPNVDYLMAILYSREGDDQNAVQCYLDACAKDRSFVNRGNLDPEISLLIKRYGLNKDPEDGFGDLGMR